MISEAAKNLLLPPYPYQIESAELLWAARYGMSGDEQGLGKSPEAILLSVAHLAEDKNAKTLVIVPAFLKTNWLREYSKFTIHMTAHAAFTSKDIPDSWDGLDVIICNYEQLPKLAHLFLKATMVVVDECQMLKTIDAKRTKLFRNYIKKYRPSRLILLSGTPIKNRVPEWFSLLKILGENPRKNDATEYMETYFRSYNRFCEHFCESEMVNTGRAGFQVKYSGFRNQKDFERLLRGRYIRHLSEDVLDLPPIIYVDFHTKVPKAATVMEADLARFWAMFLRGEKTPPVLPALKRESAVAKIPATVELVQGILDEGDESLIVFTDHVDSAKILAQAFGGRFITGETPIPERQRMVDQFQAGTLRVLVATIGTMSAGWTLTRARRMIFNDLPWVPGDFAQAVKRIHRIGQTQKCFVHRVLATELDATIAATLEAKAATILEAVKGG